jgi:hypothetical protein
MKKERDSHFEESVAVYFYIEREWERHYRGFHE